MTNSAEQLVDHDQLIREVFIDPIRTMIVVDDEYPTLDNLAAKVAGDKGGWDKNIDDVRRVRKILAFARGKIRPWLVDVHDAKDVSFESEQFIAPHLHHSDLLVLDYHLQGDTGGGDAAINILRQLALGDHFNLVIVHTKGYVGDLDQVLREIALGLTYPDPSLSFTEEESQTVRDAFSNWEEFEEGITSRLEQEISEDVYLFARSNFSHDYNKFLQTTEGQVIFDSWKAWPSKSTFSSHLLIKSLLHKKEEKLRKQFSPNNICRVQVGKENHLNWIRTDKLFVTILSKDCPPDQFEAKLVETIKASHPSPHRLLLTKMRVEIDQRGVTAEAAILGNRQIQAEWLNDFLSSGSADPRGVIHNTINRHWEALGDELRFDINNFAGRLHKLFSPLGSDKVMELCGLNKADVGTPGTLKYFNCFTSTKPIDRAHLTTGHVFKMKVNAEEEEQFLICLSPACDMVPGQKSHAGLKDCIPFIAVRLYKVPDNIALKNATKNVSLFLNIDERIEPFSIHKKGDLAASLDWEQFFARDQGRFSDENKLSLGTIVENNAELTAQWLEASVVAQLRSEYALNLLQRVGALLSRPGLGMNFKSHSGQR